MVASSSGWRIRLKPSAHCWINTGPRSISLRTDRAGGQRQRPQGGAPPSGGAHRLAVRRQRAGGGARRLADRGDRTARPSAGRARERCSEIAESARAEFERIAHAARNSDSSAFEAQVSRRSPEVGLARRTDEDRPWIEVCVCGSNRLKRLEADRNAIPRRSTRDLNRTIHITQALRTSQLRQLEVNALDAELRATLKSVSWRLTTAHPACCDASSAGCDDGSLGAGSGEGAVEAAPVPSSSRGSACSASCDS